MIDVKIADLTAMTVPASNDELAIVDVSVTAQSNDGSTRKITRANLLQIAGDVVGTTDEQTLTNKTLTTPVIASLYQDAAKSKLMTIPNTSNDTLTANDATQTLTNKTLTTPVIPSFYQDAGKTKLMTTPNTASDTLVTLAATQTLTGKTLTSPKINEDVAVTSTASELNITDGGNTTEKVLSIQPNARVYLGTNQENLTDSTWTKVLLDTESFDIGSDFASNKFTFPANGRYLISSMVTFINTVANKEYNAAIYINGVLAYIGSVYIPAAVSAYIPIPPIVDYFTTGQYAELYARVVSTGVNTIDIIAGNYYTFMSVTMLSV